MQFVTGKPIVGRKRTCDCSRPAVLVKWGGTAVCELCARLEEKYYTEGSRWDPANRKQRAEA